MTLHAQMQDFLLPGAELSVKVAQLLGLQRPWRRQVCRDTDCLLCRSYGPTRVFFQASCSWRSEGLFGQSFSIAPPLQALRGLPCLGSFSVVPRVRHIEGPPWLGSCSVVQGVGHLTGQLLYCSAADAGGWGERGHGDGPTPTRDSAVLPGPHGRPAFLHRRFPPQAPPSGPVSPQSTATLALGLLHNP